MTGLSHIVADMAAEKAAAPDRGAPASYIPLLRDVDPARFGIAVIEADGTVHVAGNADVPFSIQSISKVFTLTLGLGMIGDQLWNRVGREQSGSPFNSIVQLETERSIPRDSFVNAGAIVVADVLLGSHQPREVIGELLRFVPELADDDGIVVNHAVAQAELATGHRNAALAHFMSGLGAVENAVDRVLRT